MPQVQSLAISNMKQSNTPSDDGAKSPTTSYVVTARSDSGACPVKTQNPEYKKPPAPKTIPTMPDVLVVQPVSQMVRDQQAMDDLTLWFLIRNAQVIRKQIAIAAMNTHLDRHYQMMSSLERTTGDL